VEDQPTDSGDLTTDAAAPVPQGKSARTRHRLPRQKLRQEGQDGPSEQAGEEVVATETAAEEPAATEAAVEPAPSRRRFPWRRPKTAEHPVAQGTEENEVAESSAEVLESGTDTKESDTEAVLVPHRTAGRALKVAAIVAGILFVGATAFAGSTVQPYLADRATAQIKYDVAETAATAITTLWTYTPEDMDALPDRAGKFLSGDFAAEYRRYIDAIVETNKQAQVTNNTQVLGAAVESLAPTEASAIGYTNSVATSPVTKGIPSLRYLSYRLTMVLRNREWLITKMSAVTSLDLTPKL
jgi:Mce-associated membrane protein